MNAFQRLHQLKAENDATGHAMAAMRPRFEALRTRHEDGTAPRAIASHNLFQTPVSIAQRMVSLAGILPCHSVLEPSAGLGRILRPALATAPATVTACDISPECCRELFEQFPGVVLLQGDFLTKQLGLFDRILMNPPFHMRQDCQHIDHAIKHLSPGGVLVGLCMDGFLRSERIRDKYGADVWEVLPAGSFREEGTNVGAILFRIRK